MVEDYEPFRRSVCAMLSKAPGLQVIGEVSDGLEAVQKAEELQPDLILLDIGLPKLNGLEPVNRIQRVAPNSKIVFLTRFGCGYMRRWATEPKRSFFPVQACSVSGFPVQACSVSGWSHLG